MKKMFGKRGRQAKAPPTEPMELPQGFADKYGEETEEQEAPRPMMSQKIEAHVKRKTWRLIEEPREIAYKLVNDDTGEVLENWKDIVDAFNSK